MEIRKVSENPNAKPKPTITLGFDPVPGAYGYVLRRADGKRSNTWDPTKKTWVVDADSGPWSITAMSQLDQGVYPPAQVPSGTLVDLWQITIQPNNHEKSGDHLSYGWVKAKRNPIPGNSQSGIEGRIPFDLYGGTVWQVFGRMPTNTAVGLNANWHKSPWPNGWGEEVSPDYFYWSPGRTYANGVKGHVLALESDDETAKYEISPDAEFRKGGLWWYITRITWGRPGRFTVWAVDPKGNGRLVRDERRNTKWANDEEVLFWNGAYISNSDKMTGPGIISVTLDGIGGSLEEALADVTKLGSQELSRPDSGASGSTIVKLPQVLRPDAAILAAVR